MDADRYAELTLIVVSDKSALPSATYQRKSWSTKISKKLRVWMFKLIQILWQNLRTKKRKI
jgi:hypothetical protein